MTVRELIDQLLEFPGDTPVFASRDGGDYGPARLRTAALVPIGPGVHEAVPGYAVMYPYRDGDTLVLEIDTARREPPISP